MFLGKLFCLHTSQQRLRSVGWMFRWKLFWKSPQLGLPGRQRTSVGAYEARDKEINALS